MAWRIATELVEQIVAEAAASPGVEVCGLLLGTRDPVPEQPDPASPFALSLSKGCPSSWSPPEEDRTVLRQPRHERGGGGGTITEVRSCQNVAADPARRFEIDPAALLTAHRQARAGGPAIVGCYHSHPSGRAEPSARDAAAAAPNGWLWIVVANEEATAWRAVEAGTLHGRFEVVSLIP